MKENIAIFGAGTMANTYIDTIESQGLYNIVGLFDSKYPKLDHYAHYKVIGNEENFTEKCKELNIENIAVCIGDNHIREIVVNKIKQLNHKIKFPVLIHKAAYVSPNALIGEGNIIEANTTIDGSVRIDGFSFIGSNSALPHGCILKQFSSLASGVSLSGEVNIGEKTFLGTGSNVSHGITIGSNVIIGAGSTVLHDIPDNVVAYGTPAKVAHSREVGDKYL